MNKSPGILQCPECRTLNENNFVTDPDETAQLGFISSKTKPEHTDENEWAPHGLCTSVGCINEWCKDRNLDPLYRLGVPLIQYFEEESDTAQHMKSEYDCEVCGIGQYTYVPKSKGFECNNPSCSSVRYDLTPSEGTGAQKGEKWYKNRSIFLKALDNRRSVVDPPYKFEKAVNPFARGTFADQHEIEQENFHTKQGSEQSWIECQLPFLMAMKDNSGTAFQKIVLTTYIHKTFSFLHIEPLWLFAKRGKLGGELSWAFRTYNEKDSIFSGLIEGNLYALEHNRASIHCVYELLKAEIPWPSDRIQDEYIIRKAVESKERLEEKGYIEKLKQYNLMDAEYSLNGRLRTPIGLVECICIINALHHHSGIDNFAIDVRKEIFPNRGKSQYWKNIIGHKAELFVDRVLPELCSI